MRRLFPLPTVGWREYVALPDLGVDIIKAKIDTGAKTSAIHAYDVQRFVKKGEQWVRFELHPVQRKRLPTVQCEARLFDERGVTSSNGKTELRPVIETSIVMGAKNYKIELTLTNRDSMGFRMLIGRQALKKNFLVDSGRGYRLGKPGDLS